MVVPPCRRDVLKARPSCVDGQPCWKKKKTGPKNIETVSDSDFNPPYPISQPPVGYPLRSRLLTTIGSDAAVSPDRRVVSWWSVLLLFARPSPGSSPTGARDPPHLGGCPLADGGCRGRPISLPA